jgi:hypothetical protein
VLASNRTSARAGATTALDERASRWRRNCAGRLQKAGIGRRRPQPLDFVENRQGIYLEKLGKVWIFLGKSLEKFGKVWKSLEKLGKAWKSLVAGGFRRRCRG